MAINLKKGQTINLEKDTYDLSQVTIGLGWDIRSDVEEKKGFFSRMFAAKPPDFDLDAIAFLLDANGKVSHLGDHRLVGGDIIFFNNKHHPSGNIWLTGDNITGEGDGDDEQIIVKLDALSESVQRILFLVAIYQGLERNQHFGKVQNAFIRAVDRRDKEMARYDLSSESNFNNKCLMVFAELYRKDGGWKFRALGEAHPQDSFVPLLKNHYL